MSNNDEIVSTLTFFGLDEIDSKVYMGLLQMGASTIGTMSTKLGIDRGKAYRSVNRLRNLGMVSTTFSNPTITEAIKPDEALTTIIQKKEDEITTMEKLARKLVTDLDEIRNPSTPPTSSVFSIIQGRSNIYARVGKLIQESSNDVFLVAPSEDIMRMYHTAIPEKIKSKITGNGKLQIITDSIEDNMFAIMKKMGTTDIRVGKLPSKSRIIVEKSNQLIMSGSIKESLDLNDQTDSIMYTDSTEMVENMHSLCSHLWKKSKVLETIITS